MPVMQINNFFRLALVLIFMPISGQGVASGRCDGRVNADVGFSTPSTDFVIHNDGTVTHKSTGLMWMRCSQGQTWTGTTCTGSPTGYIWRQALGLTNINFAGYSDWRLPNVKELFSIVEMRCAGPALNGEIFPKNDGFYYWTSTPDSVKSWGRDYAFIVDFSPNDARTFSTPKSSGTGESMVQKNVVRLVRLAQ